MITCSSGDLELTPALVNTVNCVGVMGKELRCSSETRYPEMFTARKACKRGRDYTIGKMFVVDTGRLRRTETHHQLPHQKHWHWLYRRRLIDLIRVIRELNIAASVAVPPLKLGSGGLDWEDVPSNGTVMKRRGEAWRMMIYLPSGGSRAIEVEADDLGRTPSYPKRCGDISSSTARWRPWEDPAGISHPGDSEACTSPTRPIPILR